MTAPRVKICGITTVEDARLAVELGVDAIGLNFWPRSQRRCSEAVARRIVDQFGTKVRVVAVVVDEPLSSIKRIRGLGIRWVQLHGDESEELLRELLPEAFKAIHLSQTSDLTAGLAWPGDELLVDARVPGVPGGTGQLCDWDLAAALAAERSIWLAGGLNPSNVAEAVQRVNPWGVDVASGVESRPGVKDPGKMRDFVNAARGVV